MKVSSILAVMLALISLSLPGCNTPAEQTEVEPHKIVVTSPKAMDVILTQQYVCQIHAKRHINVKALKTDGYIGEIPIKEGDPVKKGDVLFQIVPTLYKAKVEAEAAEANLAELEYTNSKRLFEEKPPVVSQMEVLLYGAKKDKAKAKLKLAEAELNFATIRAPFDGIVDRLLEMQGSLVKEGDILTTLSDNSVMWVYFNVPEARYLEYMNSSDQTKAEQKIELRLANHTTFPEPAISLRIEAQFNNETGNIPFRADFPNPNRVLRHGMTGNVAISRTLHNAIVIPQRATFAILAKRYVFVVGSDEVVHQREIVIQNEQEDIFVISSGVGVDDKIIYEGVRQVRDGDKVEFEFRPPEQILGHQRVRAE
jgi:membrane fusion protein, multidrug efflux system